MYLLVLNYVTDHKATVNIQLDHRGSGLWLRLPKIYEYIGLKNISFYHVTHLGRFAIPYHRANES